MPELPSWEEVTSHPLYSRLNKEGQKLIMDRYATLKFKVEGPPIPPTPEQEAIEANPWVDDPFTLALSVASGGTPTLVRGLGQAGVKLLSKTGAKAVGKLAEQSVVGAVANIPVDQLTDMIAPNHPILAIPFNIVSGMYTGKALQKVIDVRVANTFKKVGTKVTPTQVETIGADIAKAVNSGKPDVAEQMMGVVQSSDDFNTIWYKLNQIKLSKDIGVNQYAKGRPVVQKAKLPSNVIDEMLAGVGKAPKISPQDLPVSDWISGAAKAKPFALKTSEELVSETTKGLTKLKTQAQLVQERFIADKIKPTSTQGFIPIGTTSKQGPLDLRGGKPVVSSEVIKPTGVLSGKPPFIQQMQEELNNTYRGMVEVTGGEMAGESAKYNFKSGGIVIDTTGIKAGVQPVSTYKPPVGSIGMVTRKVKTKTSVKSTKQVKLFSTEKAAEIDAYSKMSPSEQLAFRIKELDNLKKPDNAYRGLMSTSSKDALKKGETWRGRALKGVEAYRKEEVTIPHEQVPVTKVTDQVKIENNTAGLSRAELLSDGVISKEYSKIVDLYGNVEGYKKADDWLMNEGFKLYGSSKGGKKGEVPDIVVTVDKDRLGYISNEKGAIHIPSEEVVKSTWTKAKQFFLPFSDLPDEAKALMSRNLRNGDIDRADSYVNYISGKLKEFDDNVNESIFRYLDGRLDLNDIPHGGKLFKTKGGNIIPESRIIAKQIRNKFDVLGKEMVSRGLITQETFDSLQGQYVPYIMARHIIGDSGHISLGAGGKLNLSETLKRNPKLTYEQRRGLGLIEDASKAVPIGLGRTMMDIAKFDYMQRVVDDPALAWLPSTVQIPGYKKMGIGKAIQLRDIMGKVALSQPTNLEAQKNFYNLNTVVEDTINAMGKNPDGFTQIPDDVHFGSLAGAFIRTSIAEDLIPLRNMANTGKDQKALHRLMHSIWEIEEGGMRLFKMTKVTISPVSWSHNVISNILQNWLRGRSLTQLPGDYLKAIESYKAGDDFYKEAKRFGLFKTNFVMAEIDDIHNTLRDIDPTNWSSFMSTMKHLSSYYGRIDDIAKLAIFRQIRSDGGSISEGILDAQKWGMDYSLANRSVKYASQHAIPFLRYQYKIAPLLVESMTKRPWQIPLLLSAPLIITEASQHMNNMSEEEWKVLEKQIPTFIRNNNSYALLPWKTADNRWQWTSLDGFMPHGNWMGIFRGLKHGDIKPMTDMIGGPWMDLIATFKSVVGEAPPRDNYSGQAIYDRIDTPADKAKKTIGWLYSKWAPSALTIGEKSPLSATLNIGEKDKWGRLITPAQAASKWLGIGLGSISPEQAMVIKKSKINALRKELYSVMYESKDPAQKMKANKRFQEEVQKVLNE